jgi:GPH family glycoside/pentoside/hexuronide:cation symporter
MLLETMGTVTGTNYHSLFPELFKSGKARTSANALRQALQLVGMIIGVSMTPMLADQFGYTTTAAFLTVLGMSLLLICTLGSHEDPNYIATETPGLKESLKAVLGNRNFWKVSFANFFYQATAGLLLAAIPYYVKYALSLKDADATYLTAAVFVTAIPAMLLWAKLINKFGALKMWRIALAFLGVSVIPLFFSATLVTSMVLGAFVGIGISGVTANIDLINAKIIDEDAAASGLRREGIYISAISFVIRFSGFAKSLIFLLITLFFGFVDSTNTGSNPGMAARFMFSVFPVLLMTISFMISRFVRFEADKGLKTARDGVNPGHDTTSQRL